MNDRLQELLAEVGGRIDGIFFEPDHPDRPTAQRKPGAGISLELAKRRGIGLGDIPAIGDSLRDTAARVKALSRPDPSRSVSSGIAPMPGDCPAVRFAPTSLPVFGLWSDSDFALSEAQMRDSQRQVTGLWRYQRVTGAMHWLQIDRADEINHLLLDGFAAPSA